MCMVRAYNELWGYIAARMGQIDLCVAFCCKPCRTTLTILEASQHLHLGGPQIHIMAEKALFLKVIMCKLHDIGDGHRA